MRRWQRFLVLWVLCMGVFPLTGVLNAQDSPNARVKSMATLLRMRETPSPLGVVILELVGGTPLTVLGRTLDDNWLNVKTAEGQAGWVASGYIEVLIALDSVAIMTADGGTVSTPATVTPDATAQPQITADPASGGVVVKNGITLRLREAANTTAVVITTLDSGTPLEIIGQTADGEWLNVTANGQTGWVSALYVESASAAGGVISPQVNIQGVSVIYQRGRVLGNQYGVFAKIGDSMSVSEYSLDAIGRDQYSLGSYANLQQVINVFSTSSFNSFTHVSAAAGGGWTTAIVLDPAYRNTALCQNEISPLECELDRIKPSVALIQLGTNDVQYLSPDQFAFNLTRIVDICIDRGVVPVLTTIPYRVGFDGRVDVFNGIIGNLAASRNIPLWGLKASLDNLPNRGIGGDGIHPSFPPGGYADSANFANGEALQSGYTTRNLTALQVLAQVLSVMGG